MLRKPASIFVVISCKVVFCCPSLLRKPHVLGTFFLRWFLCQITNYETVCFAGNICFYCSLGRVISYGSSNAIYVRAQFVSQKNELSGNRIPVFLTGFFLGGEAQINNTVFGIAACNHVPYLRHVDIFVPNAVNHLFSHFQS